VITFVAQETINRPVEAVFAYATDPGRYHEWTMMSAERLDGGPPSAGTRFASRIDFDGRPIDIVMEYTALEPPRFAAYRTLPPADLRWDGTIEFEPIDASTTRVIMRGSVVLTGALAELEPALRAGLEAGEQEELGRLKAILEQGATAPAEQGVEPMAAGR